MKFAWGRSFIAIMITIAVTGLLLRFAIEKIIEINITQNESNAQVILKSVSTALENYAKDHLGAFPANLSVLTQNKPPYLDKSYVTQASLKGYNYSCPRLEPEGYACSAIPVKCKLTGEKIFTITTGGLKVSEECDKRE